MKTRTHPNQTGRRALLLTALLAGVFMAPAVRAQPAASKVDNRLLLIFEISSDMKPRLPAVQKALDALLTNSMNGQLHLGDSVGVWTFDQELHRGQFPLQHWVQANAPTIASNIVRFVSKQHYSKKTSYGALPPVMNQVVQGSERLTVLIFCDGKGEVHGTPYDSGINQIFQQRQEERQQKQLPIVVGLRSQRGQYVGCAVSFPPQPVSLSEFPPLPEVAQAPPVAEAPAPPSPPQSSVPSLIIVGTNIASQGAPPLPKPVPTNLPPATNLLPVTNLPPMTVTSTPPPAVANTVNPPDSVPLVQTSAVPAQSNFTIAALIPAKAAKPSPEISGIDRKGALAFGVVFVVAFLAGGLVVFILRQGR
jgi:hypothetical protein